MTPPASPLRRQVGAGLVAGVVSLLAAGCGYTARPGLATHLKTIYVKPFLNRIDLTQLSTDYSLFPIYRHGMENDITSQVINRYQFTGLLRPARLEKADSRLEGELLEFRREALRFDEAQKVEEWRLSIVVRLRFYDLHTNTVLWEDGRFIGDTTYFVAGVNAESESVALQRAIEDLARRIVERTVENW